MELCQNTIHNILSTLQCPSSRELKELTLHNSDFLKRTRHILTEGSQFKASHVPLSGGTWAFTRIEKNFQSVAQICNTLEEHTKKRVQCNAYLTPAGAQGLPAHYDLHDLLVVQVEGTKNWKIWKAFRKSVSTETLLFDETENLPTWITSPPSQELHLGHNDTLFLRAGEPHVAVATSEHSLHFSFGFYND